MTTKSKKGMKNTRNHSKKVQMSKNTPNKNRQLLNYSGFSTLMRTLMHRQKKETLAKSIQFKT